MGQGAHPMTKSRIREIRAISKANSAHFSIINELLAEIEAYQVRARRGEDLSNPAGELIAAPTNPKKKARGTIEEFRAFAIEIELPPSDGESMFLRLDETGWKDVKDWRARMRRWKLDGYHPSQKNQQPRNGHPVRSVGPAK